MIKVGDKIPSVTLKRFGANGMEEVSTDTLFLGIEWFVHRYPSGPYGPGRVIFAPEFLVQWTFAGPPRPALGAP